MIELHERKHALSALFHTLIFLLASVVLCVLVIRSSSFPVIWDVVFNVVMIVLYSCILLGFILKTRAYIHLCVKGNPIAIIKDNELCVYSALTDSYTAINWSDVLKFDTYQTKTGDYCFPVYRRKTDKPNRFLHIMGLRKDCFRYSYTDYSEEELLAMLHKHL